jgi:hypothetical protein
MNRETTNGIDKQLSQPAETLPEWLKVVRTHVESLKFGEVHVTIHDSRVVQIERVEKTRLDRPH